MSKRSRGEKWLMRATLSYCAWGCFRYFLFGGGVGRRSGVRSAGPPSPSLGFGTTALARFVARACLAEAGEASEGWWARQDSNLQPDRYERPALTIELQAPPRSGRLKGGRQRCRDRLQGRWRSGNPGFNRPKRRRIPPPCATSRSRPRPVCRIRPGSSASAVRRLRRAAPQAWNPSALRRRPC
jgi:hypothetical protein